MLALSACLPAFSDVECVEDANCDRFTGGLCHLNPETNHHWCSYPDASCPTGYRYSDLDVGDGVESACTHEPPARCDLTKELEDPTLVPNINSSFDEVEIAMTSDERTAFITRNTDPFTYPPTCCSLLMSERTSPGDDFPVPAEDLRLSNVLGASGYEHFIKITGDGLILYYNHYSTYESVMSVAARASRKDAFSAGTPVTVDGPPLSNAPLWLSADGQALYWWDGTVDGGTWSATRTFSFSTFGGRTKVAPPITFGALSRDQLTLFYYQDSLGDIMAASRSSQAVPFSIPGLPVSHVNSPQSDIHCSWPTTDACSTFAATDRAAWVAMISG